MAPSPSDSGKKNIFNTTHCLTCNGTGDNLSDPFGKQKCVSCHGTGTIKADPRTLDGHCGECGAAEAIRTWFAEVLPKELKCDKHPSDDIILTSCCEYCEAISMWNNCLKQVKERIGV